MIKFYQEQVVYTDVTVQNIGILDEAKVTFMKNCECLVLTNNSKLTLKQLDYSFKQIPLRPKFKNW